mmetsp:Transcript_638/g.2507  ORF Transcript_638/g.2507 Transcript_638/m.2507 type:complete len:206 (+) Transcript_638:287-904(+)
MRVHGARAAPALAVRRQELVRVERDGFRARKRRGHRAARAREAPHAGSAEARALHGVHPDRGFRAVPRAHDAQQQRGRALVPRLEGCPAEDAERVRREREREQREFGEHRARPRAHHGRAAPARRGLQPGLGRLVLRHAAHLHQRGRDDAGHRGRHGHAPEAPHGDRGGGDRVHGRGVRRRLGGLICMNTYRGGGRVDRRGGFGV